MNKNKLNVVREYKFDKPLITDADSIIENCFNDCRDNFFDEYKYECLFLTIVDRNLDEDGLNKELKLLDRMVLYLIK